MRETPSIFRVLIFLFVILSARRELPFTRLFGRLGQAEIFNSFKGSKKEAVASPLLLTALISRVCHFTRNAKTKYNSLTRFWCLYQAEIFNGFRGSKHK